MFSVDLEGVDDLEASLAAVAHVLQDPQTAEAGTRLIAESARPLVPREVGTLAASDVVTVRGNGARLTYQATYSVTVQARQPWLGAGIRAALPDLLALYDREVQEAWT